MVLIDYHYDKIIEHSQIVTFIKVIVLFCMYYASSLNLNISKIRQLKKWFLDEKWLKRIVENGPMHVKIKGFFPHNNFKWFNI